MTFKTLRHWCGPRSARLSILCPLGALFLILSCGKEEPPGLDLTREIPFDRNEVLAETAGQSVTVGEFINAFPQIANYEKLFQKARIGNETSYLIEILDQMEDSRILADRAREKGYVGSDDVEDYIGRLRMDKIVNLYYIREILLRIQVTEEEIRDRYEEVKMERFTIPRKIKIKWIWIKADKWGWEKAEERAKEVAEMLEGKKEFEELIYTYTDSTSPYRYGDFGWYERGEIGTNLAVDEAAFSLDIIGQFTGPVRAGNGFHFVKLTGVQEEQSVPFEDARLLLRDEVIRDKVAKKLAELVETGLETMDVERNFELLNDPDADDSATLFRVEDFRYPLGRFRRAAMLQGLDRRSEQEEFLKQLLRNAIVYRTAIEAGYGRLNIEKTYQVLINDRLENIYLENEIENRIRVTERELLARYEREKESLRSPTRLHPYWILIRADVPQDAMRYQREIAMRKAQQYANRIYYDLLLQNGEPFTDLARKHSNDQPTKGSGGDLGLYEGGNMGRRFDEVAFSIREGQISHPVELKSGYCLIWLREIFAPRQMTFDEARPELYRRTHQEKTNEMYTTLQQEIREGRAWIFDEELLARLARFLLEAREDRMLQAQLIE